jgi:hypothetical protein
MDFSKIKQRELTQYDQQINRVRIKNGYTKSIEETVATVASNLSSGAKSLAIYGEPQSGKTEMMICLSAKLLDDNQKTIIVLVNDSIDVLGQNYRRFQTSGLVPAPKSLADLKLNPDLAKNSELVLVTKKNQSDLKLLIEFLKAGGSKSRVVIDDEADYATPNSKINKSDDSRINALVTQLVELGEGGIYIGVTATPARLDLNNTLETDRRHWVYFDSHPFYNGHESFFPTPDENDEYFVNFHLELMPDESDSPSYLTNALQRFLINVAAKNIEYPDESGLNKKKYSMLIHTSGSKEDHKKDAMLVSKYFNYLADSENPKCEKQFKELHELAREMYPGLEEEIVQFIYDNRQDTTMQIINSERDRSDINLIESVTDPKQVFTVAIGGNIISRGVTFNNLLCMFFTRNAKHKIQTDTYVQRARMFGVRNDYLQHFELHIPKSLYRDWHTAFVYHRLGMSSIKSGEPIWYEDERISSVSSSSKDKRNISQEKGEVSFGKFEITSDIMKYTEEPHVGYSGFSKLVTLLPENYFGNTILKNIENLKPSGDHSLVIHASRSIENYKSLTAEDRIDIRRGNKGLFYGTDASKFPKAVHHFQLFFNGTGQGRFIYKFVEEGRKLKIVSWRERNK